MDSIVFDDYILKLLFGIQQAMGLSFEFSFFLVEYEYFREIMIHAIFIAVFFCQEYPPK